MASTQKGTVGVAWSLVTGVSGTGVTAATSLPQSVNYDITADKKEITGADGDVKCIIYYNQRESMTIEVIPSAATLATANSTNILPAPGADITIADSNDAEIVGSGSSTPNARWHFDSGSKAKTIDGEVRLTMNLSRYVTDLPTIT